MRETPTDPRVFHITHLDNLEGILSAGCLWKPGHIRSAWGRLHDRGWVALAEAAV